MSESPLITKPSKSVAWEKVEKYYDDCALFIQDDSRAMGWSSEFTQQLRFDVISYLVDLTNQSIFDIGCGDGAFYHYLKNAKIPVKYKGIDISKKMVSRAQERSPGIDIRCANYVNYFLKHAADTVVVSGAFSYCPGYSDSYQFLFESLSTCFAFAKKNLVVNLLTSNTNQKSSMFHSYDPRKVLDMAFELTPYVSLNHSYMPNDFTLLLSKA